MSWWSRKTETTNEVISEDTVLKAAFDISQKKLKDAEDAIEFYKSNVDTLNLSMTLLEKDLSGKMENLRIALIGAVVHNGDAIIITPDARHAINMNDNDVNVNIKEQEDGSLKIFLSDGPLENEEPEFEDDMDWEDEDEEDYYDEDEDDDCCGDEDCEVCGNNN